MNVAVDNAVGSSNLRKRVGSLGGRMQPGISGLWQWWKRSLTAWLSPKLRLRLGLTQERLLLRRHGDQLERMLERDGVLQPLEPLPWAQILVTDPLKAASSGLEDAHCWLLLPASAGLQRSTQLPVAALPRLRQVLGFEIDRQTPFNPADVYYDVRVAKRDGDRVQADLIVVPRTGLEAALQTLGPVAQVLSGVDMAGADGRPLGVNLLESIRRRRQRNAWRAWNWVLSALALGALVGAMALFLQNRRLAEINLQKAMSADSAAYRRASAERNELRGLVEGVAFLQAERNRRPAMVEVLAELAQRLPPTTYLERVSTERDELLLNGQSTSAASLVSQLEGATTWRNPALSGALQPDPQSRRDRFAVTAPLSIAAGPNSAPVSGGANGDSSGQ